ncbi:MAG TPA: rhomboid family intramembrane serine protease [Phototrophicaceae bacterium]|nr:rhomboid family intramembrane serine protease [Phototrophicaceae bacterium]
MGAFFIFLITIILVLINTSLIYPLPFSDTGTVRYRSLPYMTFALIIVNSLVFMAWQAPSLYQAERISQLQPYIDQIWTYGWRPIFMTQGQSVGAFVTFTSIFMHADFFHLFGNMIYLWTFGRRVEDACGHWRFLLYYLAAGMIANIGSTVLVATQSDIPGIGASGAIAGVMGAYLVLFPGAKVDCLWGLGSLLRIPYAAVTGKKTWTWTVKLPAFILLIYFAVQEFLPSLQTIQNGQTVGVNHLAHVMGFLGAIIVFLFVRKDLLMRYVTGRRV